jgi:hypothetical protein
VSFSADGAGMAMMGGMCGWRVCWSVRPSVCPSGRPPRNQGAGGEADADADRWPDADDGVCVLLVCLSACLPDSTEEAKAPRLLSLAQTSWRCLCCYRRVVVVFRSRVDGWMDGWRDGGMGKSTSVVAVVGARLPARLAGGDD